jgi:hypothetical protein
VSGFGLTSQLKNPPVFGVQYLVMTTMMLVFEENYNMSEGTAGLIYIGRGIGSMLATLACRFTMDRYIQKEKTTPGGMKPEHQFSPIIIGSISMPLSFFLYGWWIVPVLGTAIYLLRISRCLVITFSLQQQQQHQPVIVPDRFYPHS